MNRNMLKYLGILICIILLSINLNAQEWQSIPLVTQETLNNGHTGGEGGQWPQAIEVDRTDGSFLLFGTDVGGIYRSTNGGELWEPCNIGYHPRGNCGFAIDPNNNQRALAIGGNSINNSSHGIYLTEDQASSWKHVFQEGDYDGYRSFREKAAFDPTSYDTELSYSSIAYWSNPVGGLYKSSDGGHSWSKINLSYGNSILKVSAGNGIVYIGNANGFYRSIDGGLNFTQILTDEISDVEVSVNHPLLVWIATKDKLYLSNDEGETFTEITSDSYPSNVISMAVSPANKNHITVCHEVARYNKPIYFTKDGGLSWTISGMDDSNAFLPFNGRTQKMTWHPTDENKIWAFGGDWITSSSNGGALFEWDANGYTGILEGGFFTFNLFNPDLIYMGSQDYNGGFSKDNGESWIYCNASNKGWGGHAYGAYAIDESTLVTMASPGWHEDGQLTMSRDSGKTFINSELICTGYEIGNGDPKDPDVVYFSNYYSKDRGESWEVMEGCDGVLAVNLYGGKEVYGAKGNSVVKSIDKGDTWIVVTTIPSSTVRDLAYDHVRDKLYIVGKDHQLYEYLDGVLSNITTRIPVDQYNNRTIRTVAVDPQDPKIVYTAGTKNVYKTDASVKRSFDAGRTWHIITPNLRTNNGKELGDGANEVFALRVHPVTRELWAAGGCYGMWKMISVNPAKVELTSNVVDSDFSAPAKIEMSATVSNYERPVSKVEFYQNGKLIGEDAEAPYDLRLENVKAGNYEIYAVSVDTSGFTAVSLRDSINILHSELPHVQISSPSDGSEFEYNSTIGISADAYDPDGSVSKVGFYSNDTKLGEATDAPYIFFWKNVTDGEYSLIAKVTDNTGQTVSSAPVNIRVKIEAGTIYYTEDFNDGLAQDWSPLSGTWELNEEEYQHTSADGASISIYTATTFADYSYSATGMAKWNNNFGLVFNYQDENNYYLAVVDASPSNAYLVMIQDGTESILEEASYPGGGTFVDIKIEVKNNGISSTVLVNDAVIFENISTSEFSSGYIGLYTFWNPVDFDDVRVDASGSEIKPRVSLNSPVDGNVFIAPANVEIKSEVMYSDSSMTRLEVYSGDTMLEETADTSINYMWTAVPAGLYNIYALYRDSTGKIISSDTISIAVLASELPEISISSPSDQDQFELNSNIEILADVSDPEGDISKVVFFNDDLKIADIDEGPWMVRLAIAKTGEYVISASVTDGTDQEVSSDTIRFTVGDASGFQIYNENFDDGEAQNWKPLSGSWNIFDNQFVASGTDDTRAIYTGNLFSDHTFSGEFKFSEGFQSGLYFNFIDEENYGLLKLDPVSGGAGLVMNIGGTEIVVAESDIPEYAEEQFLSFELKNDSSSTTVKLNDELLFYKEPSSEHNTGHIGLYSTGPGTTFDNLDVVAKYAGESPYVSVRDDLSGSMKLYPNPASGDHFTIEYDEISYPVSIHIYDITGILVYQDYLKNGKNRIPVKEFPATGVYIIKISDDEKSSWKKLIINE